MYSTDPFEHWIIDDFLPNDIAQWAYDDWDKGDGEWTVREHLYCRGKRTRTHGAGEQVEVALEMLESPGMLAWLSAKTGVQGLIADPLRFGGGQHVTVTGGRLGIHADFTHHPVTGMRRALNLLVYLTKAPLLHGGLQLWDAQMRQCVTTIEPKWNRAVLFKTSVTSYHGHPDALVGGNRVVGDPPAQVERRSLAAYYYTADGAHPQGQWCGQPTCLKTTDYRPRPWEYGLRLRKWASKLIKGDGR